MKMLIKSKERMSSVDLIGFSMMTESWKSKSRTGYLETAIQVLWARSYGVETRRAHTLLTAAIALPFWTADTVIYQSRQASKTIWQSWEPQKSGKIIEKQFYSSFFWSNGKKDDYELQQENMFPKAGCPKNSPQKMEKFMKKFWNFFS